MHRGIAAIRPAGLEEPILRNLASTWRQDPVRLDNSAALYAKMVVVAAPEQTPEALVRDEPRGPVSELVRLVSRAARKKIRRTCLVP